MITTALIALAVPAYTDHLQRFDRAAQMIYAVPMCEALDAPIAGADEFARATLTDAIADGVGVSTAHVLWIAALEREVERQDYLREHMPSADWVIYWREQCDAY